LGPSVGYWHDDEVASVDWAKTLDLDQAVANIRLEFPGDWYRDPWDWPELGYVVRHASEIVFDNCTAAGARAAALVDVPKENWGARPAVVLDIVDRVTYQALADRLSTNLIGDLSDSVFGWRLPPTEFSPGKYSRSDLQWDNYRAHLKLLAAIYDVALVTDLTSFFASISLGAVQDAVHDRAPTNAITRRLFTFLEGVDRVPERSGLPQRSTASAVLANMLLRPIDDLLAHHATRVPLLPRYERMSFARWMDDMWLFVDSPGTARRAQVDLQGLAHTMGLHLNSAKTEVLEGDDVETRVREIEHSGVDHALDNDNQEPLEDLVDRVLDKPEQASRTTIRFLSKRIRDHEVRYRLDDLLSSSPRMPHGADSLSHVFRNLLPAADLEDWLISYAQSEWGAFEWSTAQFFQMLPSGSKPARAAHDLLAEVMSDGKSSLPLLAVASQRMAAWDPGEARTIARDTLRRTSHPQARRILALAALGAGETRSVIRKWLKAEPDNGVTLRMLERYGYRKPKVSAGYAN
jgi:hypothetical protein